MVNEPDWGIGFIPEKKYDLFIREIALAPNYQAVMFQPKWLPYLEAIISLDIRTEPLPYDLNTNVVPKVLLDAPQDYLVKVVVADHLHRLVMTEAECTVPSFVIDSLWVQLGYLEDDELICPSSWRWSFDGKSWGVRPIGQLVFNGESWYTVKYYEKHLQPRLKGL